MFRTFIDDTKAAAGAVIGKYALRASVAVPFVAAGGFATAAATLMLVDRFGALAAYWAMAGVFVIIGILATVVVSAREHEVAHAASPEPEPAITPEAGVQAATQLPLAMLGAILTTPFGPAAAGTIAKALVRHLPLAVLSVLIGYLLFAPSAPADSEIRTTEPQPEPDVAAPEPAASSTIDRQAA